MSMELYNAIPALLVKFIMTVAFAFIVGLEFRRYRRAFDIPKEFIRFA